MNPSKEKKLKKVLKTVYITNQSSFTKNLELFLDKNPNIKIKKIIKHSPYCVSLIYEVTIPV